MILTDYRKSARSVILTTSSTTLHTRTSNTLIPNTRNLLYNTLTLFTNHHHNNKTSNNNNKPAKRTRGSRESSESKQIKMARWRTSWIRMTKT